jgi:exopolysaccharide production protein ExoZ
VIKGRVESVQALRAIAALFVVTLHTFGLARQSGFAAPIPFGDFGVDIFFVISGFVMVLTTQRPTHVRTFIGHRLMRVVPLYWILTTLKAVLMLALPALGALQFSLSHVIASYAFVPWYNQAGAPHPIVYVGWTLTYELWFYLIFALLQFRVPRVAIACLLLTLLGQIEGPLVWNTLTDPLLLEFVMGMGIASVFLGKSWWIPALVACCVLLLPDSRAFFWGLPSAVLVGICVALEKWWPRTILSAIGDSSYSLYLTHIFVIPIYFRLATRVPTLPSLLVVIGAFVSTIVVGHLTYLLVEKPLGRTMHKFRKRNDSNPSRTALTSV